MDVGVRCLPILSLITFFIGLILALQVAYELRQFGAMSAVATAPPSPFRCHESLGNTSRSCPGCRHVAAENRKAQAKFSCTERGFPSASRLGSILQHQRGGLASLGCSHASCEVSPSCQEPSDGIAGIPSL